MFQKALSYLIGPALPYIAGAVAIAFIALSSAYWMRGAELRSARADLKTAKADVDLALRTIAGQKQVLQECSDRTLVLKVAGDKNRAEAEQELARLRKVAEKYQASDRRLAALSASPTPSGASCSTALAAIRKELRK